MEPYLAVALPMLALVILAWHSRVVGRRVCECGHLRRDHDTSFCDGCDCPGFIEESGGELVCQCGHRAAAHLFENAVCTERVTEPVRVNAAGQKWGGKRRSLCCCMSWSPPRDASQPPTEMEARG